MATAPNDTPTLALDLAVGRRRLLIETGFAQALGSTATGAFMTALVVAFGGKEFKLGLAAAALMVGSVGMLAANPILNAFRSRRVFCVSSLAVVRILRLAIACLPLLLYTSAAPRVLFVCYLGCVLVSAMFGMAAEISRRSWIASMVPPDERGRFFAKRTMIRMLTGAAVTLAGGWMLDVSRASTGQTWIGLTVVVGFGAAMGFIGWSLLISTPEPEYVPPRRPTGFFRSLAIPFRRPRFRPLLLVAGWNHFATSMAGRFFQYYMLNYLGLSWTWIVTVDLVGDLLAVAAAPAFGAWADRAGARRVLTVVFIFKGIFPALWILLAPEWWPAVFVLMLFRTFNSGGQVCWGRLAMNLSPERNKAAYMAMHQTTAFLAGAVGALLGGTVAMLLREADFAPTWMGFQIVPLHVVFFASMVLRLSALPMLRYIREPRHAFARKL